MIRKQKLHVDAPNRMATPITRDINLEIGEAESERVTRLGHASSPLAGSRVNEKAKRPPDAGLYHTEQKIHGIFRKIRDRLELGSKSVIQSAAKHPVTR